MQNEELYAVDTLNGNIDSADFFSKEVLAKPVPKKKKKKKSGVPAAQALYATATPKGERATQSAASSNRAKPKLHPKVGQQEDELYSLATKTTPLPGSELYDIASSGQQPDGELYEMASSGQHAADSELYDFASNTPGKAANQPAAAPPRSLRTPGSTREPTFGFPGEDVYEEPVANKWQPLMTKSRKESGLECHWVPSKDNPAVYRPVFRFVELGVRKQDAKSANDLLNIAFLVYPTKAMNMVQHQWMLHRARAIVISNVIVGAAVIGAIGGGIASSLQNKGGKPDPVEASSVSTVQPAASTPSFTPRPVTNSFTTTTTGTGNVLPTVTPPSETTRTVVDTISSTVSSRTSSSVTSRTLVTDTTTAAITALTASLTTATATSRTTGTSPTATSGTSQTLTTPTATSRTTPTLTTVTATSVTSTLTQTTTTVTATTITTFTAPNTERTGPTQGPRHIRLHRREITNTTHGLSNGFNDLSLHLRTPSSSWWAYMNAQRFILPLGIIASITATICAYFASRCNKKLPISAQSIDYGVWQSVANHLPDGVPIQIATYGGPFANSRGDYQPPTPALVQANLWPGKPDLKVTVYITLRYYLYRAFGMEPDKKLDLEGPVPRRFAKR